MPRGRGSGAGPASSGLAPLPLALLDGAGPVAGGEDLDVPGGPSVDGPVTLRASRWGAARDPDSPTVLLLHGLASQRRFFDLVVPHLVGTDPGPALPVVALDQRGHGESGQPATGYGVDEVVADAVAALDALGVRRVVAVGHSWGSTTALGLAARHPDRVAAVVSLDGVLGALAADDEPREVTRRRLEPPRWRVSPEQVQEMLTRSWGARATPALLRAVLPIFGMEPDGTARARLPFDVHMEVVDALLSTDLPALLREVRCPAWLLSAEPLDPGDPVAARRAEALGRAVELLADPRPLRWAGAVHDVPLQHPAAVAGLLRAAVEDASLLGTALLGTSAPGGPPGRTVAR